MRPTAKVLLFICVLFVMHTGYYPIQYGFEGYESFSAEELSKLDLNTSEAIVLTDVKYGESDKQRFDLFLPSGRQEGVTKVLVLLHGGSWVRGDKAGINSLVATLLDRFPEHAIVNMNYSLAGKENFAFPNQFNDIQKVLDHMTINAARYQVQPIFGIVGKSAGGHLGLMFDNAFDKYDQVKFVCSIAGPTNLTDPLYMQNAAFEKLHTMLIDTDVYKERSLKELSPLHTFSKTTSPSLLLYGKKDRKVPVSNGLDYAKALDEAAIKNELHLFEGGHIRNWTSKDWQKAYDRLEFFVGQYLN